MTNKEAEAALRALHHDVGELLGDPERLADRTAVMAGTWGCAVSYIWQLQIYRLPVTEESYERFLRDAG